VGCSLLLVFLPSFLSVAAAAQNDGDSWVQQGLSVWTKVIETPLLPTGSAVSVSPDGKDIAYAVLKSHLSRNNNDIGLWLASVSDPTGSRIPTELISRIGEPGDARLEPHFSPDGQYLAYVSNAKEGESTQSQLGYGTLYNSIAVRNLATGVVVVGSAKSISPDALTDNFIMSGLGPLRWSPDSARIAVLVRGHITQKSELETEVDPDNYTFSTAAPTRLAVYDLANQSWRVISPPSLDVDTFDWAPDGQSIALSGSGSQENQLRGLNTGIYVLRLSAGSLSTLVPPLGKNGNPHWSPDGRYIAFITQRGQSRLINIGRLGVCDVSRGTVRYPAFEELGRISGFDAGGYFGGIVWAADSRSVLINVSYQMSHQIFRISLDGAIKRFTTDDRHNFLLVQSDSKGHSIFMTQESFLDAPELIVSSSDRFDPHQVTHVVDGGPILRDVEAKRLQWPSRDGKWTIHGWLLLPKAVGSVGPRPLLVYAAGGPDMISPHFGVGDGYPIQAFLDGGVAVLIPNSRGRPGYGTDFAAAWETERDCGQGPLEDDLAGVEMLVDSGVADPQRVAMAGHSWGGYLAAYALTHSSQFKAILIHEAVNLNVLKYRFFGAGSPRLRALDRQFGWGVPFEPGEKDRLENLSPVYRAGNATTPSLLEFGVNSEINDGRDFFEALKYFDKAPTELISYPRTAHVTEEPALKFDAARRELEWFSYWVLGKATKRMLDRYGPPPISDWTSAAHLMPVSLALR
jgi:dipeptidyl aminopeptidase/acylaminoacyl peptidase